MNPKNNPDHEHVTPTGAKRAVGRPAPIREGKLFVVALTLDPYTKARLKQVGSGNISAGVRILCAKSIEASPVIEASKTGHDKYLVGHPREPSEDKLSRASLTVDARTKVRLKQIGSGNISAGLRILCADSTETSKDISLP